MRSRSSLEGHKRLWWRPDIGRARPDEPIVVLLLDDLRAPAGDARADEDRRVEVAGKPYQKVGHGGVEVQVGVEALFLLHDPIHDGRDVVPPRVAARPAQGLGMTLDDGRAGVALAQHAMAEAHHAPLLRQRVAHPALGPVAALDLQQHGGHRLVGAPWSGPLSAAMAAVTAA